MMELTMAATHPHHKPTVCFQNPDEIPDFHPRTLAECRLL
jgi:hypothetical protein